MKRSKCSETQTVSILKEADAGASVKDSCRQHDISDTSFYNWRSRYGGLRASELKRLREIEEENAKLKRMYAGLALENSALKDPIDRAVL